MYDMQSGLNVNTAQKNRHPVKGDGLGFVMNYSAFLAAFFAAFGLAVFTLRLSYPTFRKN